MRLLVPPMPRPIFLVPALLLALPLPSAKAQTLPAVIAYASRAECEQASRFSSEQCGFAFLNARAEFEEKAPRYRARHDCVRLHKTCSAQLAGFAGFTDASRASAIYVPSFSGVAVAPLKGEAMGVTPRIAAGATRFKARKLDAADDRIDGRVAVVPDSHARGSGARRGDDAIPAQGPYVKRGDRDDTIKMKLPVRDPNDPNAVGLFVDKDGVEWYRPARRQ